MVYYGTRGHGRGARDTPSPLRGQNLFCLEDESISELCTENRLRTSKMKTRNCLSELLHIVHASRREKASALTFSRPL